MALSDNNRRGAANDAREHIARDLLGRFHKWRRISAMGVALAIVGALMQVWSLRRLSALKNPIGVQPAIINPFGVHLPIMIHAGGASAFFSLGFLVAGAGFFVAMFYAREVAEASRVRGFKWSYGWAIASLFIPIFNFFRPWVWFAETRRAIFNSVEMGRVGAAWTETRSFNVETFALAIAFMCANALGLLRTVLFVIDIGRGRDWNAERLLTLNGDNLGFYIGDVVLQVLFLWSLFAYLETLKSKLSELVLLAYSRALA